MNKPQAENTTIWLSRLDLDLTSQTYEKWRNNMQELHLGLVRCVPRGARILFRVEPESIEGSQTLIVQSLGEPNWRRLNGALANRPIVKKATVPFREGTHYGFRLYGNAIKRCSKRTTVKSSGMRGDNSIKTDEGQTEWLQSKAALHGFKVDGFFIDGIENSLVIREIETDFQVYQVKYEGSLTVVDASKFAQAFMFGVGRGKSFGCGLLSLRR